MCWRVLATSLALRRIAEESGHDKSGTFARDGRHRGPCSPRSSPVFAPRPGASQLRFRPRLERHSVQLRWPSASFETSSARTFVCVGNRTIQALSLQVGEYSAHTTIGCRENSCANLIPIGLRVDNTMLNGRCSMPDVGVSRQPHTVPRIVDVDPSSTQLRSCLIPLSARRMRFDDVVW